MYGNVHPYEGLTYSHNLYALLNSMTPQSSLPYVCFVTRLSYSCNNNICASWACYSCNSSRKDGKGVYVRDPARKKTLITAFNVLKKYICLNFYHYFWSLILIIEFLLCSYNECQIVLQVFISIFWVCIPTY